MKLWVLGSGSRGNAVVVESAGSRVLIDAGFTPQILTERLATAEIPPESIDALVITHEHIDHVRGARNAAERFGWTTYATAGTITGARDLRDMQAIPIRAGEIMTIGDLDITPIAAPHDAHEPIVVVATARSTGARAGVIYDVGCITQAIAEACTALDLLVIEANHDEAMLHHGPYPPVVQQRIAGRHGHLSNRAAMQFVRTISHRALKHVILAHLSESCNTPALARSTVHEGIASRKFAGMVSVTSQQRVAGPFEPGSKRAAATQLDLWL